MYGIEEVSFLGWELADRDSLRRGGGLIRSDDWDGLCAVKLRRGEVRSGSSLLPCLVGEIGGKKNGGGHPVCASKFLRSYSVRPTSLAL